MINVREFIKNLGDSAPAFFEAKPETVKRWLKTGNVPMKMVDKVYAAYGAMEATNSKPSPQAPDKQLEVDPLTHLPTNLDRRLPQVQLASGRPPDVIEISPLEQNFGANLTRPGRMPVQGQPMKLREENGQKVAFVENTPPISEQKNPDGTPKVPAMPPMIGPDWAETGPPIPQPKRESGPTKS